MQEKLKKLSNLPNMQPGLAQGESSVSPGGAVQNLVSHGTAAQAPGLISPRKHFRPARLERSVMHFLLTGLRTSAQEGSYVRSEDGKPVQWHRGEGVSPASCLTCR